MGALSLRLAGGLCRCRHARGRVLPVRLGACAAQPVPIAGRSTVDVTAGLAGGPASPARRPPSSPPKISSARRRRRLPDILSREPGIQMQQPVRRRQRRAHHGRHARLRRRRRVQHAGPDQWPPAQRSRPGRRRSCSAIPRDSIERIEITRGNSGAVLYGDGAVGGVINIVTKTRRRAAASARIEGAFGSFNYREGNVSASGSSGPWSATRVRQRHRFRRLSGQQRLTPAQRRRRISATPVDRAAPISTSRPTTSSSACRARGVSTRRRHQPARHRPRAAPPRRSTSANKQGASVTAGVTRMLAPGAELIVDGGVRQKKQQAQFFVQRRRFRTTDPLQRVDTDADHLSVTPRVKLNARNRSACRGTRSAASTITAPTTIPTDAASSATRRSIATT